MSFNQLKTGAILSYVGIGLNNIIGLLYTPLMLRMLGQSEYGLYSLVASVVGYLTIMDFGFGNAIIRYTAKLRALKLFDEQYSLFGMFLTLYSIIGIISFLLGLVLYININQLFGSSMTTIELMKAKVMIIILIINVTITFPLSIFGSIITAYENFIFIRTVNIVRIILNPVLVLILLYMGYKAIALVIAITVLNILSLYLNYWYSKHRLHIKIYFRNYNWKLLKEIIGYSFFIFLNVIVDKLYWSTGHFVLGMVAGTTMVAIYAVAIQFNTYFMSFSTAISGVFLPKITKLVAKNTSDKEISDLFIKVGRIQFIIIAFIVSGFILFGKSFIVLWAGTNYIDSFAISLIIMLPLTIPLMQNLGITILQARNQLKFRSIIYVIIAICGLLLSIPLAKLYGGIGCAIGTSFCLIIGNIVIMNIYYYKIIHIDIPRFWKEIFVMSLPIVILSLFSHTLNVMYPYHNFRWLFGKMTFYSLAYFILVWFIVLNKEEKKILVPVFIKIWPNFNEK